MNPLLRLYLRRLVAPRAAIGMVGLVFVSPFAIRGGPPAMAAFVGVTVLLVSTTWSVAVVREMGDVAAPAPFGPRRESQATVRLQASFAAILGLVAAGTVSIWIPGPPWAFASRFVTYSLLSVTVCLSAAAPDLAGDRSSRLPVFLLLLPCLAASYLATSFPAWALAAAAVLAAVGLRIARGYGRISGAIEPSPEGGPAAASSPAAVRPAGLRPSAMLLACAIGGRKGIFHWAIVAVLIAYVTLSFPLEFAAFLIAVMAGLYRLHALRAALLFLPAPFSRRRAFGALVVPITVVWASASVLAARPWSPERPTIGQEAVAGAILLLAASVAPSLSGEWLTRRAEPLLLGAAMAAGFFLAIVTSFARMSDGPDWLLGSGTTWPVPVLLAATALLWRHHWRAFRRLAG